MLHRVIDGGGRPGQGLQPLQRDRPPTDLAQAIGPLVHPVQRVFHPVAVHFKGSGFYNTDYGTRKRKRELDSSASEGADKTEAKAKESKKDTKSPSSGDKK